MIVLIPMAGRGERFRKENFALPKPVLPIDDIPMVVKAALDLPAGSRYVFALLREHIEQYHIDEVIKEYIPTAEFVILDFVTEGQASTCLYALDHTMATDDELMIGACDNGMIYNKVAFEQMKQEADVVVFTFRNNVTVVNKPQQYGWVAVGEDDETVSKVSVKVPISDKPIHDHAIVGAFWFRSATIFREAVNRMVAQNRRVNNEFYVDECVNDAIALGYRVKAFEINKYICWGTPADYRTYNYWKTFHQQLNNA